MYYDVTLQSRLEKVGAQVKELKRGPRGKEGNHNFSLTVSQRPKKKKRSLHANNDSGGSRIFKRGFLKVGIAE